MSLTSRSNPGAHFTVNNVEPDSQSAVASTRPAAGRRLGALILFKVVWLAIVTSAVWSVPALGAVAVAVHFAIEVSHYGRRAVVVPVLVTGLVGYLVDNLYVVSGLLSFPQGGLLPAPIWMALLWMNFALVLEPGMDWLDKRPMLAAALGATGGPLAYSAGIGLGLIETTAAPWIAYGVIGVVWALAMPILVHFCRPGTDDGITGLTR